MKTTTLLMGATGLLGTALAPRLALSGLEVVRHGSATPADVNADLRNREAAFAVLDSVNPASIVNLVALTDVDTCENKPQEAYLLNVRTTENVVAWVKRHPRTRLIQISTDQVYDGPGPHREDDAMLLNIYAYSKYCAECIAASVDATILRTNFFGHVDHARKTFSDWIVAGLKGPAGVRLVTDVLFSPLSIDTLCRTIRLVLERPMGGTFNLGSHGGMSKYEFGRQTARHLGLNADAIRPVSMADLGLRALRPKDMRMDVSLFQSTFGMRLPELRQEILSLEKEHAA